MLSKTLRQMLRPTIAKSASASFSIFANHRLSDANTDVTPFEFTDENYEKIEDILSRFPKNYKQSATIPLMMLAQKQNNNFLSLSAMHKIAKILEIPHMQVYEVASFYTMFNRTPVGKYHL